MARVKVDVPKRNMTVVDRVHLSGFVIRTNGVASQGETASRWHYADGLEAPGLSVRQAISRGLLVPSGDGLFGSETSQTYRAA